MYGIISCSVLGQRAMLGTGEVRLRSDVCGMCTETFQKTGEQQAAGSGMGGPGPGPGPRELASLEVALWTWHTTCEKVSMTRPKKKKIGFLQQRSACRGSQMLQMVRRAVGGCAFVHRRLPNMVQDFALYFWLLSVQSIL